MVSGHGHGCSSPLYCGYGVMGNDLDNDDDRHRPAQLALAGRGKALGAGGGAVAEPRDHVDHQGRLRRSRWPLAVSEADKALLVNFTGHT